MRICCRQPGGFTLIELMVTLAILAMLSTVALPMAELAVQRGKEQELHAALRQIRDAIDAYKTSIRRRGSIVNKVDESGYPPTLDILVAGCERCRKAQKSKKCISFCRTAAQSFRARRAISLRRRPGASAAMQAVPTSRSRVTTCSMCISPVPATGINGVPYKEW
jgi:general secretion pathway protein G